MIPIVLHVNQRRIAAAVEPRTHLADFVRDHLDLTGTHLGCEHGVCGACTLLLDDMPARSCITSAVACDGARVTTIEGLDGDAIAIELRAAFQREHALQCGYCTPGMLISARDLVLRLPDADDRAIRIALSGNLCRCTGYVGIVRAIKSVIEQRRRRGIAAVEGGGRHELGPVGSGHGAVLSSAGSIVSAPVPAMASASATGASEPVGASVIPEFTPTQILNEHFTVPYPPRDVFERFGDVAAMASCLPGVSLTGLPTRDQARGVIRIKLGPITASFQGSARIERDPADLSGRILGIGGDQRSRSTTQGEIRYRLVPLAEGAATRVELSIGYRVRGTLAQVARAGLVRDLAGRLTADFAGNLARQLAGLAPDPSATASPDLNVAALVIGLLRRRARETFRRIWRR